MSLLGELQRRNVFKVGAAYVVMSWVLVQVADVVLPTFNAPEWVLRSFTFLLMLGFPVAVILAWAYEVTPKGIQKTKNVSLEKSITRITGQKLNYVITAALAVALVVVIIDNYVLDRLSPPDVLVDVSQPVPGFSNRAAIAVLPFVNLSGDPEQEYFSDGITEDIITGLQSFGRFPVIARTSTFSFKGESLGAREIASTLGAGYVLEGSVRKVENKVRINAQLIDARGRHIWAELYDRDLHDIFAVQDEIRHQIIAALEPEMLSAEMDRASLVRTEFMEAWDYYLQAAALAPTFGGYADRNGNLVTPEGMERALELAAKAIELDPAFADAYTLYGHIKWVHSIARLGQVAEEVTTASLREGFEYARRGRELNPFSATTCSCYVTFLAGWGLPEMLDLRAAIEIQENAVRLNPANAFARGVLSMVYVALERYEEGLKEARVAKRLSPRDLDLSFFLFMEASNHLGLGEFRSAADISHDAVLLTPFNYDGHAVRIAALYSLGETQELIAAVADLEKSIPNFEVGALFDAPLPRSMIPAVGHVLENKENPRFKDAVAAILAEANR